MTSVPYYRVYNYQTGDLLAGPPSAELVEQSAAAGDTGAVGAYRSPDGEWQWAGESSAWATHTVWVAERLAPRPIT